MVALAGEALFSLFEEIWVNRCYAGPGLEPNATRTVVDIGANVGVFSV